MPDCTGIYQKRESNALREMEEIKDDANQEEMWLTLKVSG